MTRQWKGDPPPPTERELEVLRLVAQGLTSKQIAEALGISWSTARHHRENIWQKLAVHNAAQASATAAQEGWL